MPKVTSGPGPALARQLAALDAGRGGDPTAPVTAVVPGAAAARRLEAALARQRHLGAAIGPVCCTGVDDLVAGLAAGPLGAAGLRPAPAVADVEALRSEARAGGGRYAALAGGSPGLAALHRAVAELRRCPPTVVEALARRPGVPGELARLATGVGHRLRAAGLADPLAVVAAAEDAVARGPAPALGPVVVLDAGAPAPAPGRILERLATHHLHPVPGPAFTDVLVCADPAEEARAAARAVVLSLERGVAPGRQAVLHPPGPRYGRAVLAELASAGIPAHAPELRRLDRCAAGRGLLGLLALAGSPWRRADVVAWMASAPVVTGPGGPAVPAARWDALSARAGVLEGPVQWHQRLGRLADLARHHGDDGTAEDALTLARFVDGLVRATATAAPSWAGAAARALELLDRHLAPGAVPWPEAEALGAGQVRAVVAALAELDALAPAGPADATTLALVLGAALGTAPWDTDHALEAVTVAPVGFARGMAFDDVVVVGLTDAAVDGQADEGLLPEEARRLDVSGGLRTRPARAAAALADVAAVLGATPGRRTATVPRTDPRAGGGPVPARRLAACTDAATRWRAVDSFAASLAQSAPARSRSDLELGAMARWVGDGHDLAQWPPLLGAGRRRRDRLVRAVAARRARHGDAFTRFDGDVGAGALSPFAEGAVVSPTRLETFVRCPRRYLLERSLGVRTPGRPEELWRMGPAERGSLVHAVLEDYVVARLGGAPRSATLLRRIADAHLDEAEHAGAVGRSLGWSLDRAALVRELERFHAEEGDATPLAAELDFGSGEPGAGPAVAVALGGGRVLRFHGRADRVDRTADGRLVVSDYKTGRQGGLAALRRDPVAGGRLLQLPVYALAASERFGGGEVVTARYWLLSDRRIAPSFELALTAEVQARFVEVLGGIGAALERGAFPGAPADRPADRQFDACRHCDLDRLCPPDRHLSWARKAGAPALAELRELLDTGVPADTAGTAHIAGGPGDGDGDGDGAWPGGGGAPDPGDERAHVAAVLASFSGATVAVPPPSPGAGPEVAPS